MTKKSVTALTALSALALSAIALSAVAQASTTGTIRLNGTVQAACTISVTDAGVQLNVTGGETNRQVGTVVENCNSGSGYRVTLTSANAGALKNGSAAVSYSVSYDNQQGNLTGAMTVERPSVAFGKQSVVAVSMPANATAVAGAYSDTLTITVAAR